MTACLLHGTSFSGEICEKFLLSFFLFTEIKHVHSIPINNTICRFVKNLVRSTEIANTLSVKFLHVESMIDLSKIKDILIKMFTFILQKLKPWRYTNRVN